MLNQLKEEDIEEYFIGTFGDERLKKRGALLLKSLCDVQKVSLRKLGKNRSAEVGFGRFLKNEKVTTKEIQQGIVKKTKKIVANEDHVLGLQDTTELNFQSRAGKITGMGVMGNGNDLGFALHPLLVLEANSGACLGLAHIHHSTRLEKLGNNNKSNSRTIEEKESYRWISTALEGKKVLAAAKIVTIIGDRENDIYECFNKIPDLKTHLLVRARFNRKLVDEEKDLFEYLESQPVQAQYQIEVKRNGGRKSRIAEVELKYCEVKIKRPLKTNKESPEYITVTALEIKEIGKGKKTTSDDEKHIHWRLLTTHKIDSIEKAKEVVRWYCLRWQIEQLFRTLKTQGINIESSQIETAESIFKLTSVALQAAVQSMQLVQARDGTTNRPVGDVFEVEDIEFLNVVQKSLEGKTEKQKNHYAKETLSWAAWIIGRLGGWKGYASESPPGPITMNRGLEKFSSMKDGFLLAKSIYCK